MTDSENVLREFATHPEGVPLFFHFGLFRPSRFLSRQGIVQPWWVYGVGYFTTAYLGRALRKILTAGDVKFRRMPLFFSERHPFPSSSITASSHAGPGPLGQLLDPTLRSLVLLPSFFVLASVVCVLRAVTARQYSYLPAPLSWRSLTSWTTAACETSWQHSRPMPFLRGK